MFHSLRSRLTAVYLGLIIIGFGGLTLWAGRQIAISTFSDFSKTLQAQAFFLANQLIEPLEHDPAEAAPFVNNAATAVSGEITIYTRAGNVILSSAPTPSNSIYPTTEAVQSNNDGTSTLYVTAEIRDEEHLLGIIQIGVPTLIPQAIVNQRWAGLAFGFFAVSFIGILVSLWLLNTLTKPLSHLRDTAHKMAEGDLSQRVTILPKDEIGEVGDAFNEMAEQVEAVVNEQRAFASNASHELRTPLTTIRLRTEALRAGDLDAATTAEYIEEIDGEVKRMSNLVDDLLLLSRLDAQKLEIGKDQIDPERLLKAVVREFENRIEAKQLNLCNHPVEELVPAVQANMSHLRIVYRNVIENSVKYTPPNGQIDVRLSPQSKFITLQVVDNGRGIAPEDLAKIGKRFFRTDKARTRDIEGTGLGLALVHSILDLYGGTLHIESEGLDKGTAVTVLWPLTPKKENA